MMDGGSPSTLRKVPGNTEIPGPEMIYGAQNPDSRDIHPAQSPNRKPEEQYTYGD